MEIKLKVGVAVDASLRRAFQPLVQSAIDARRQILREFGQVPKEITALFGAGGRGQSQVFRGVVSEARAAAREQQAIAKQTAAAEVQAAKQASREQANLARIAQRAIVAEHRAAEREKQQLANAAASLDRQRSRALYQQHVRDARESARELDRFATRTSHYGARYLAPHLPIASMARRAASALVGGIGLDPTVSGAYQRNIGLENAAVAATNQARLNGQDVSVGEFEGASRGTAKKYGISNESAAGALGQYQKLSGDLKGGMDMLDGLALRAVTTGVKVDNLASAAGNVSKALGDIPNKGAAIFNVLDTLTVQGAKGAIEISDLATQVAKLSAPARMIAGDAGVNTARLGAIAQIARDIGGASGPAQATTSVTSLMNTFDKGARAKAFAAAGIELRDKNNQLRDPYELIKAAIVKSGGDPNKLNNFIMDAQAKRAARGFLTTYNQAGGGGAGVKAMDDLMASYMQGNISDSVRNQNLEAHNSLQSTQVQKFQEAIDEVVNEVQSQLLPVLRDAQPTILAFIKGMADLTMWVAANPGKAIVAAIVASIARAGLESALRAALERAITAGGGGGRFGKVVSALPFAGAALALGGAAAADIAISDHAAGNRIKAEGASLNKFRELARDPSKVTADQKDALYRDILNSTSELNALDKRNNPNGNGFFDISGQWDWLKSQFQENDIGQEIRSRDAMLTEKKALYETIKNPGPDAAAKTEQPWQRVTGKPGETADQLKARVMAENTDKKEQAQQRAMQEKMVGGIVSLATAATGGGLKVNVQNFPDASGDSPTAPPADPSAAG